MDVETLIRAKLAELHAENSRLIALLESHGIEWRALPEQATMPATEPSRFSIAEKIALFRKLFRGRTDRYPVRWESRTSGKSGYAPACANEWVRGVCEKPESSGRTAHIAASCPSRMT